MDRFEELSAKRKKQGDAANRLSYLIQYTKGLSDQEIKYSNIADRVKPTINGVSFGDLYDFARFFNRDTGRDLLFDPVSKETLFVGRIEFLRRVYQRKITESQYERLVRVCHLMTQQQELAQDKTNACPNI